MSMKKPAPQSIRSAKVTFYNLQEKARAKKVAKPLPLGTWMHKKIMEVVEKEELTK